MKLPLTISFRNMKRSQWIEQEITDRASKLDEFCTQIMSCRVVVEMPHKHHHQGNACLVRIDLTVPGKEIVITREAPEQAAAENFRTVIRDSFDAAKRQLQDYSRRQRKMVKTHTERPHGKVTKLFPDGYGFIETPDGREIYFNCNSVINDEFAHLQSGSEVTFDEEEGDKGTQASTVRVLHTLKSIAR